MHVTAPKVSKYGVISSPYFPAFGLTSYLSLFSPNASNNGPEITPYLDTFLVVCSLQLAVTYTKFVKKTMD